MVTVEICCGSYNDCIQAALGGAKRVELCSGLSIGGLTPSLGELRKVLKSTDLEVIAMIRPRGAGFNYSSQDFEVMLEDAKILLENGAAGISFGCLDSDGEINVIQTRKMMEMVKRDFPEKTLVFHRAFDCTSNPISSIETLIELGIHRVITGGQQKTALRGASLIKELQGKYGKQIEIMAANDISDDNLVTIINKTSVQQVHCACRELKKDTSFYGKPVNYAFHQEEEYEVVSKDDIHALVQIAKKL